MRMSRRKRRRKQHQQCFTLLTHFRFQRTCNIHPVILNIMPYMPPNTHHSSLPVRSQKHILINQLSSALIRGLTHSSIPNTWLLYLRQMRRWEEMRPATLCEWDWTGDEKRLRGVFIQVMSQCDRTTFWQFLCSLPPPPPPHTHTHNQIYWFYYNLLWPFLMPEVDFNLNYTRVYCPHDNKLCWP